MPEDPSGSWSPPSRFDGFELKSLLGQGGMGRVYLAYEELLERQVAIKFILAENLQTDARERFLTEARAVARLNHANIVAVYRVGEVDDQPYVAYEYVAGHNLDDHPRPAPWADVLRIGLGVSRALAAAHSLIERALQRRPSARFASAVELLEALESLDAVLSRFRSLSPSKAEALDGAGRVVASLSRVGARSEQLYVSVYEQLFLRKPELRSLFPTDMGPQRAKLTSALELVVQNLRCPEHIVTLLEELGQRHIQYGATVEHLAALVEALLVGLELHDPMAWDAETRDAWRAAYASISQAMQRGLRSGTVTKSDIAKLGVHSG